jgi:ferredoxin
MKTRGQPHVKEESMSGKDLFEQIVKYYEAAWGPILHHEEFKGGLKETLSEEEAEFFFLLPEGGATFDEISSLVAKHGISLDHFEDMMKHMGTEGMIWATPEEGGQIYERNTLLGILEIQMRKAEPTRLHNIASRVLDAMIDGQVHLPTKTPIYRVIPVESTLPSLDQTIDLNASVPDTRTPIPADIVSKMVRSEKYIAKSSCICRLSRQQAGKGCDAHAPIEVCLGFGKFALALANSGTAKLIDADEAIKIIRECSELGLVTTISNIQPGGGMDFVCNCCNCCCLNLNSMQLGITNIAGPSRYVAELDQGQCNLCEVCIDVCPSDALALVDIEIELDVAKCIGCGLCAARCPTDALRMVLRAEQPYIPATNAELKQRFAEETRDANMGESIGTRSAFFSA